MSTKSSLTPQQVAKLLTPRLLSGEILTRQAIQEQYELSAAAAQKAVREVRWILLDEHNAFVPVANWHGNFELKVTTDAVAGYWGEQPQMRAIATSLNNSLRRLGAAVALEKVNPRMGANVYGQIGDATTHIARALESADIFMDTRKETA